ncbi:MAG TPA: hypothetical protein VKP08_15185 [Anaerolineales bacterium]|nr:hypothetical protein [Anaerolineales bacterium]
MIAKSSDRARLQQYLDQYAFALRQANAIIMAGPNANNGSQANTANGQSSSSNGQSNSSNSQVNNSFTPQQNLGWWLHMMRGLREKISTLGVNNVTP